MTQSVAKRYTTNEYGKQNIFPHEPQIRVMEDYDHWTQAELINGRLAMIGLVAAVFNYSVFGWIIPGIA
tara:strand:+ start:5758 stop:5964 length:207 start_codon:yes stop_codon:yes gene_type:complete